MARYTNTISTKKSAGELTEAIRGYLKAQGYKPLDPADQNVWQKGGWFSNPFFIRFDIASDQLNLEAWLRFVILPGVFVGSEYDLEGMFLIVAKRALKKHVEAIERLAG